MVADVIVIGAGIVGAACAHALAHAGQRVLVLDARLGGATNAGMGHLVVMDDNPAELALSQASLAQWHAWAPRMAAEAPSTAFTHCGTLWVAADAEEMQEAEHKRARLQAHGIACELLSARELATQEPVLRPGLHGALRVSGDSMVYAPNAAEWLLGHAATPIQVEHCRSSASKAAACCAPTAACAKAAPCCWPLASTPRSSAPSCPSAPRKATWPITDRGSAVVRHQLVELGYVKNAHQTEGTSVAFNLQPRPTGQWLLGSSRQFDTLDPAIDTAVLARMLRRAHSNTCRRWPSATPSAPGRVFARPHPMAYPSSAATQSASTCGSPWGTKAWA